MILTSILWFATLCLEPVVSDSSHITLVCGTDADLLSDSTKSHHFAQVIPHNFSSRCPEAFDFRGTLRQKPHMCTSTSQRESCLFLLPGIHVTKQGALYDAKKVNDDGSKKLYSFSHKSMGHLEPLYYNGIHDTWSSYYENILNTRPDFNDMSPHSLVVPTRMRWDDCFNHLSFQSLPLIGHVYEFHHDVWTKLTWHASKFTAAMLLLLGVPMEKIVIERQIFASEVFLPWVKGWAPPQISTLFGVTKRISEIITTNLLDKYKSSYVNESISNSSVHMKESTAQNLVLFLRRPRLGIRGVVNEEEIFRTLRRYVNRNYEVIVVNHTAEQPTIEKLHKSWYHSAKLFSRAAVVIGPHGGAFNNLIWVPSNCSVIEFNEFPDDDHFTQSHGETPVRSVFLTAAWAKGITGKFFIIEPSMKHPVDMYTGKLRISPYELFEVMKLVPGMLQDPKQSNPFYKEVHGVWPQPKPNFSYVPKQPEDDSQLTFKAKIPHFEDSRTRNKPKKIVSSNRDKGRLK